ncbi:MAG: hypothetical protein ACTSSH_04895 [Candidatus Heimdallarchaeota archaeon]
MVIISSDCFLDNLCAYNSTQFLYTDDFWFGGLFFFDDIDGAIIAQIFAILLGILYIIGLIIAIVGFSLSTYTKSTIHTPKLASERKRRRKLGNLILSLGSLISLIGMGLHFSFIITFKESFPNIRLTTSYYLIIALNVINIVIGLLNYFNPNYSVNTNEIKISRIEALKTESKSIKKVKQISRCSVSSIGIFFKGLFITAITFGFLITVIFLFVKFRRTNDWLVDSNYLKIVWSFAFMFFGLISYNKLNSFIRNEIKARTVSSEPTSRVMKLLDKTSMEKFELFHKNFARIFIAGLIGATLVLMGLVMIEWVRITVRTEPEWMFYQGGITDRDYQLFWNILYWLTVIFLYSMRIVVIIVFCLIIGLSVFLAGYVAGLLSDSKIRGLIAGFLIVLLICSVFYFLEEGYIGNKWISDDSSYLYATLAFIELVAAPIGGYFGGKRKEARKYRFNRPSTKLETADFDLEFANNFTIERKKEKFQKDTSKDINFEQISAIEKLIDPIRFVDIDWLMTVTQYEEEVVIAIVSDIYNWILVGRKAYSQQYSGRIKNNKK